MFYNTFFRYRESDWLKINTGLSGYRKSDWFMFSTDFYTVDTERLISGWLMFKTIF
jgi:hypothetical protein